MSSHWKTRLVRRHAVRTAGTPIARAVAPAACHGPGPTVCNRCGPAGPPDRAARISISPPAQSPTGATPAALPYPVRRESDEFDFGYALTVHKAQGSQWDDVVLFDESRAFREHRARWLYTGVTRAAKRLTLVR